MINFCTYLDINYLSKALVLIDSLKKNHKNFRLYILLFDDFSLEFFKKKKIKEVIIIDKKKFEDKNLLNAKKNRTNIEYFWTCTPSLILFSLNNYKLNSCTYIDADLFFYSDVSNIIRKKRNKSVYITDHFYTPKYKQTKSSGQFNVQFITFFNEIKSKHLLTIWREQCIEWCYNKRENNKFGDQKYLDSWKKYSYVHIHKERGCGVAPWNLQQYKLISNKTFIYKNKKENLYFFHFHQVNKLFMNYYFISSYKIDQDFKKKIYIPYIQKLNFYNYQIKKFLEKKNYQKNLFYKNAKFFLKALINFKNIIK